MLQNILVWLRRLFGTAPAKSTTTQSQDIQHESTYQNTTNLNITAIIANKLASIACADTTIEITGKGPRAEYIRAAIARVTAELKTIAARTLGIGGVWLVPYNIGTELYADVIPQSQFFVVERRGAIPTAAQYVAEIVEHNNREYVRAVSCHLDGEGNYTIVNRAVCDGNPVPIYDVPQWREIPESIVIPGVDRLLVGFVKCPVDGRDDGGGLRGVPITYGQEQLIGMIQEILAQIPDEYRLKRAFIGASDLLFSGKGALPDDGLYMRFDADGQVGERPFWEVFSPEIRHSAYFEGLDRLMAMLEKAVGLNRGVLTDLDTRDATATAIRRSMYDTFNMVDALRVSIEAGVRDIAYAFDRMATAFGFAPEGEYGIRFGWSYSLLEDSQETWKQMREAVDIGAMRPEELRAWLLDEEQATK